MNHKPSRTQEAVLVNLRNALQKLELNTALSIDTPLQAELNRVLRVRIANLEAESAAICRLLNIRGNDCARIRR
jgi:hypothetical protein